MTTRFGPAVSSLSASFDPDDCNCRCPPASPPAPAPCAPGCLPVDLTVTFTGAGGCQCFPADPLPVVYGSEGGPYWWGRRVCADPTYRLNFRFRCNPAAAPFTGVLGQVSWDWHNGTFYETSASYRFEAVATLAALQCLPAPLVTLSPFNAVLGNTDFLGVGYGQTDAQWGIVAFGGPRPNSSLPCPPLTDPMGLTAVLTL